MAVISAEHHNAEAWAAPVAGDGDAPTDTHRIDPAAPQAKRQRTLHAKPLQEALAAATLARNEDAIGKGFVRKTRNRIALHVELPRLLVNSVAISRPTITPK